jgi:aryl-alcohol dehydrogenase-like predicted oxidoreductase
VPSVNFRKLGSSGIEVSEISLGSWLTYSGGVGREQAEACVKAAFEEGINFIDTANVYNRGHSEEAVGEALKRRGRRDSIVLATKVHGVMDAEDPNGQGNSRRHIIAQCEASLRRLQTDWIDLYQIHRPQSDIPIDETLRALDDLIRAGKVRYVGTSTFGAWQLVESVWVAKEFGLNRFVCEQPPYNLLDRRIERELVPAAQTYGVGLIPWSPLAGGLLTGKYQRGQEMPEGARFASANYQGARRLTERVYDVVEALQPLAAEKGCTLSQLALAWVMAQPGVTSAIIGPRTMEQLDDNLGAVNVELTEDDRKRIDRITRRGENVAPFYEADFGPHQYRTLG